MGEPTLEIPQVHLDILKSKVYRLQASIFRTVGFFKKQPKIRQLLIEPVLKEDFNVLIEEVKKVFPEDRIEVRKGWRQIRINTENIIFSIYC